MQMGWRADFWQQHVSSVQQQRRQSEAQPRHCTPYLRRPRLLLPPHLGQTPRIRLLSRDGCRRALRRCRRPHCRVAVRVQVDRAFQRHAGLHRISRLLARPHGLGHVLAPQRVELRPFRSLALLPRQLRRARLAPRRLAAQLAGCCCRRRRRVVGQQRRVDRVFGRLHAQRLLRLQCAR